MPRLRFLTAGESHGPALVGILEGLPAGIPVEVERIARDLARRRAGYGRGGRMRIEDDAVEILSGVRFGKTLGSPVGLMIRNRDFSNWSDRMRVGPGGPDRSPVTVPRPGHADLAAGLKYGNLADLRAGFERASARETAMRTALGAVAKLFLRPLGIGVGSFVAGVGAATGAPPSRALAALRERDAEALSEIADRRETRALDDATDRRFKAEIDRARRARDTVGGVASVFATGVPPGLGSTSAWDARLDARIAGALVSIPAIKAVEIGEGISNARRSGSSAHDPIALTRGRLTRRGNRAGGIEGGVSNGEAVSALIYMKPLSTVPKGTRSVDLATGRAAKSHVERTDSCAVPAAGVVAEAVLALVLADALLESLGGDTLSDVARALSRRRAALSLRSR